MEVGLGLYLSCERKKHKKRVFLLPVKALEAMPKVRYWHRRRKVSPNVWLPPQESTPPTFLSLWTVSKAHSEHFDWCFKEPKKFLEVWKTTYGCFSKYLFWKTLPQCVDHRIKNRKWQYERETFCWRRTCTRLETWKHAEGKRRFLMYVWC